jgi:hypothetical protein
MASKYQNKLIKEYEKQGYYVIKLGITNKPGIADLLCLKANEIPLFIESKEANDTVKPLQLFRQKELINLGFQSIIKQANE